MAKITKIQIKEIKGISDKEFRHPIIPNRPNLFVAQNGFGKSSFAVAFDSMKKTGISVDNQHLHMASSSTNPQIIITLDDNTTLVADATSNQILDVFSVFVINSQLYSKASARNTGKYTATQSSISVRPITLVQTIPKKTEFRYALSIMKKKFGGAAKLLRNLQPKLKELDFVDKINYLKDKLEKMKQKKSLKTIGDFLNSFSGIQLSKTELNSQITNFHGVDTLEGINDVISIMEESFPDIVEFPEKYINAIQLFFLYHENKANFTKIVKYFEYLAIKEYFDETLSSFDITWKNISAKKDGNSLVVDFPPANSISNGERDILCLVAKLFEAERKLTKDRCILIIDEIFDYLDDGNIVAAQYYINKFIEKFKRSGRELFPIILTHLDPQYFKTYSFNVKNTHYLDGGSTGNNLYNINNLLKSRPDGAAGETIAKYYLHYDPNTGVVNEGAILAGFNVDPIVHSASDFQNVARQELIKYTEGGNYDVAFVCCGLRIEIEKKVYHQLDEQHRQAFLDTHKTNRKLEFAESHGIDIPDTYKLLGIIYNEALHLDPQSKKLIPVSIKLRHAVIRNMIREII